MGWEDRILDDGTDRVRWQSARRPCIGASDAAKYSRPESVEAYLRAKLKANTFGGNAFTVSGHKWEADMLAWAGMRQNLALVHSPDEVGFAATPDAIDVVDGVLMLAECKAKHDRIVYGPDLSEWRQLAWQFVAVPEAEAVRFIWAEVVGGELRQPEPKELVVSRDDPKITELTEKIMPIAAEVLARLRVALEYEGAW